MTLQKFRANALEGGITKYESDRTNDSEMMLKPSWWIANGKVEGWNDKCMVCKKDLIADNYFCECRIPQDIEGHIFKMHAMIDALAEGKSLENYINSL